MKSTIKTVQLIVCFVLLKFNVGSQAQSIQMSNETFQERPSLPFAPAQGAPVQDRSAPPIALASAGAFQLEKGKRVDEQLLAFGRKAGWTLVWQAPDYVLDQSMVLPGDFEASVVAFLQGANEAGIRLRATFYRGNKTVRVTEF